MDDEKEDGSQIVHVLDFAVNRNEINKLSSTVGCFYGESTTLHLIPPGRKSQGVEIENSAMKPLLLSS